MVGVIRGGYHTLHRTFVHMQSVSKFMMLAARTRPDNPSLTYVLSLGACHILIDILRSVDFLHTYMECKSTQKYNFID